MKRNQKIAVFVSLVVIIFVFFFGGAVRSNAPVVEETLSVPMEIQ